MEVTGQLHATTALLRRNSRQYPLDRRGGGQPQSRSGRCEEEKNVLPLPGIEPQFPCPITTPIEISRLVATGAHAVKNVKANAFKPYIKYFVSLSVRA
jgi:hypothetical protein